MPPEPGSELRIRTAARAVVVDRERRVLLVHFDFTDRSPDGLWACPGGGVNPGESLHDGVIRELAEETGLILDDPGEPVWTKSHTFAMTNWDGQHDTYYFVETDHFEPRPAFSEAELKAEHVDGLRWWEYDELLAAQAAYDSGDRSDPAYAVFSPRQLGHHLRRLFDDGRPGEPIEVSGEREAPGS